MVFINGDPQGLCYRKQNPPALARRDWYALKHGSPCLSSEGDHVLVHGLAIALCDLARGVYLNAPFIDTHAFLSFYTSQVTTWRSCGSWPSLSSKSRLSCLFPQQVIVEFQRNRETKIADAIKGLKEQRRNLQFSQICKDYPEYSERFQKHMGSVMQRSSSFRAQELG